MNDEALLSTLIRYGSPRKTDTQVLAHAMLRRHGSLAPVLESLPVDLIRSHGLTNTAAYLVHLIPELARYMARERMQHVKQVGTFEKAGHYLRDLYIGAHNECFYLLCMDSTGQLISNHLVQQGTVDEAPFYLRHILDLALRAEAYAVVLSHNHPSGTPYPSRGDADCTLMAIEALLPMDILVLDHILVADGLPISIRASDAMPSILFERQKPNDPLIAGWYDIEEDKLT